MHVLKEYLFLIESGLLEAATQQITSETEIYQAKQTQSD